MVPYGYDLDSCVSYIRFGEHGDSHSRRQVGRRPSRMVWAFIEVACLI